MTTCRNCPTGLTPDDSFCRKCGQVVFADEKLETAVRKQLGKPAEPLTKGVIRDLTSLGASSTEINNGTPIADSDSSSSFLQGLAGHATSSNVQETYGEMLVTGEQVLAAYKWVRDEVVLTSLRIIYMDVQGLTGKKKSSLSIPYESIHKFSKESAGWLDWDAELRIWVRGEEEPIK